nr:hypothetical protein [Tanacetum cinerariifolium]
MKQFTHNREATNGFIRPSYQKRLKRVLTHVSTDMLLRVSNDSRKRFVQPTGYQGESDMVAAIDGKPLAITWIFNCQKESDVLGISLKRSLFCVAVTNP